jgi:hypothetical protein
MEQATGSVLQATMKLLLPLEQHLVPETLISQQQLSV